jgi:hypothetical protein
MVKNIINPELIAPVVNSVEATEALTVEISPTDQRFAEAQRLAHLKYAEAFRELAK